MNPSFDDITSQPTLALRPKHAAIALGIGERKLWQLTKDGAIPSIKVGACVLYPVDMLKAWMAAQVCKEMQS